MTGLGKRANVRNRCFYLRMYSSRELRVKKWRDSDFVLCSTVIIWSGVQLCLITLFVPETYHPVLLRRKAIRLRKETGNTEWIAPIEKMDRSIARTVLWSCIRPFELLFFEPMVGQPT